MQSLVSGWARVSAQNGQPAHQKLTFEGDTALWTIAIKPDKTADFEQIMAKMRAAHCRRIQRGGSRRWLEGDADDTAAR